MSISSEYSHRPRIPTVEEILSDFDSCQTRSDIDVAMTLPVVVDDYEIIDDKSELHVPEDEEQRLKDIHTTYKEVSDFLEQNSHLQESIESMNMLSAKLHAKKEYLTELITNIKQSMKA